MNNQNNQNFDYSAWFQNLLAGLIENGAFLLGMALMFSKTVDLMTAFAPSTILGYEGVEVWYGVAVGVLIEGALFVMKLLLPRPKNVLDWLWNVVVILVPFALSGFAQVFDSFVVRDTLSQQPDSIRVLVAWFVPSIPTIIMALFIGKAIFASMPAEIAPRGMPRVQAGQGGGFKWPSFANPFKRGTGKPAQGKPGQPQPQKKREEANPTPASINQEPKQ